MKLYENPSVTLIEVGTADLLTVSFGLTISDKTPDIGEEENGAIDFEM